MPLYESDESGNLRPQATWRGAGKILGGGAAGIVAFGAALILLDRILDVTLRNPF